MKLLDTLTVAGLILGPVIGHAQNPDSPTEGVIRFETGVEATVAKTTKGLVAGYIENGVYIYKGVPYAKAERFMAPTEVEPWEGVRSSRSYGPVCPQGKRTGWKTDELAFAYNWNDGHPSEDCLNLNVWTRGLEDGGKRPVIVWMHPGGYTGGSSYEMPAYDGANLARNGDVVVVSFNHRLNELGFLDLSEYGEEYAHSANVGMLDALAVLQWVRDNIENFGGDPGNVTIIGQSGGGGKVATLMAMPAAKGLFHKAIVQSGSMISTMEQKYSRMIAAKTLELLGLEPSGVDKLKKIPYEDLHKAGQKAIKLVKPLAVSEGAHSFIFGWAPVADGADLPFQPDSPEAMELSKDIPLIVGSTRHEAPVSFHNPLYRNPTREQAMEYLSEIFGDRVGEFVEAYEACYGAAEAKDLVDYDLEYHPNALRHAWLKAAAGGEVWLYLFDWEAPVMDGILRSIHCSDIPYFFDNVQEQKNITGGGPEAEELARKMSGALVRFARYGSPTARPQTEGEAARTEDGTPTQLPDWEPFTEENEAIMIFGDDCRVEHGPDKTLMDFVYQFPIRGITATQP